MSLTNRSMLAAKNAKNNEFYTTFEHMENLFQHKQLASKLKNKILYLPCDTEESKIYIFLKRHQAEFGIKEIMHTSDDYFSHLDLYNKCDIVFTNPPFTGIHKYINFLEELKKDFVLWLSWPSVYFYGKFWDRFLIEKQWKILTSRSFEKIKYDTPTDKWGIQSFVFTNIDGIESVSRNIFRDIKAKNKSLDVLLKTRPEKIYFQDDGTLYIQNILYFPNDYYGEASVHPQSYYTSSPYLEFIRKEAENTRFSRYIVKLKH